MYSVHFYIYFLLCFSFSTGAAESPHALHGAGKPVAIADIVPGRFHNQLAALPPEAQAKAMAWLSRMRFHDHDVADLHADAQGDILFSCSNTVTAAPLTKSVNPAPGVARAAVPIANQPSYHSKPGATNRIYLDFNGATVTGTNWSTTPLVCPPLDIDSTPTTFNDAEQIIIQQVWQRVAEDYAPFNVDVTTDPALESSLNNNTGRVVITRSSIGIHPGSGGVAYVSVFGQSDYASTYSPAFVYFDNLASREDYIAEACSHEMGHNLGLSHDATVLDPTYYGGHGTGATSWGPIMGTGYDRNVSQFSKGEYYDSLTDNGPSASLEDDLSIIDSFLTYRADDYGNTNGTATGISGATFNVNGIIGKTNDIDVLSFTCRSGPVTLTATPWRSPVHTKGGNLDLKMGLYDATGSLVMMSAQAGNVGAAISTSVTAGTYFIRIANDGEGTPFANPPSGYTSYGSLGQWTLTGTSVVTTATITTTDAAASESGPDTGTFTITLSATSATPTTVAYTVSGTATNGTDYTSIGSSVSVPANATSITVTVMPTDDALVERPETVTVTIINSNDYLPGVVKQATVTITDNDLPSVSIAATDAQAAEAQSTEASGNTGLFTVTLSADVAQNTTITYLIAGSAINGNDYNAITSSVIIPANTTSATILITPIDDTVIEDPESVQLTLTSGSGYLLGTSTSAPVTITDNDLPIASITATDAEATEASGHTGLFTVTLSAPVSQSTTLTVLIAGTAINGTDYTTIDSSVTIPANATQVTIPIAPLSDDRIEGAETVQLSLRSGSGYAIGTSTIATITITDNTLPPDEVSDSKCGLGGIGFILALMLFGVFARRYR